MKQNTAPSTPKGGEKSQPGKVGRPRRSPEVQGWVEDQNGELHPVNLAPKPSPKARSLGEFVRLSCKTLSDLATNPLPHSASRVLNYLLATCTWQNSLDVRQHEISAALGIQRPNIARALKQLVERGLLVEVPPLGGKWRPGTAKQYVLSPHSFAKGKDTKNRLLQESVSKQIMAASSPDLRVIK